MKIGIRIFLLILLFAATKAHIRILIRAILGLAGLWMIHVLAQDYQKLTQTASTIKKLFSKRSIIENENQYLDLPELNWSNVLSNDPIGCVRSFVCQLAAEESVLDNEEKLILLIARHTHNQPWVKTQIQNALKMGENALNPIICRNMYTLCPYSRKTMIKLLKIFGKT